MGWDDRREVLASVLVQQKADVLDTAGLGAVLRRMGAIVPASASWQREHAGVVDRLRECDSVSQ